MKITSQEQAEKLIKNGVLECEDHLLEITCSINIDANINARHINARHINAWDINALDINARDINALDINARDINALDINAWDINALDINAWDINALDIKAWGIKYHAVCFAYRSIECTSIKGTRQNSKHFCLDGEITIKDKSDIKIKDKSDIKIAGVDNSEAIRYLEKAIESLKNE